MRAPIRFTFAAVIAVSALGLHATTLEVAGQATATQAGRAITQADLDAWNSISQNTLSPDGKWFAYVLNPREGDGTLILRGTAANAAETRIALGDGGGSLSLSGDSKWLGYLVAPPSPPAGRAGRGARGGGRAGAGRAGGGRAGAGGGDAADRSTTFVMRNLETGEVREFERIRRFAFNADDATWIAMQGYPASASADAAAGGGGAGRGGRGGRGGGRGGGGGGASGGDVDLLLYNIASDETFNIGRVGLYAFDEDGDWLAYTRETPDQVGNSVQLYDLSSNVIRAIDSERALYSHLAWVDSSRALSVMRGELNEATEDTVFSIVLFTDFGATGPTGEMVFDPATASGFPAGWKLASNRAPDYADDMSAVFFGIREANQSTVDAEASPMVERGAPGMGGRINQPPTQGEQSSLILWHALDDRLQSQQIVQEQNDRNFNYDAEYRFDTGRFVRLADDDLRSVNVLPGDRFAYGTDNSAYQQEASYSGRNYNDVYRVDLMTGERALLWEKRPSGGMSPSPDGTKLLLWGTDGHYWLYDMATGDSVNITRNVPTSFVDTEDDHNNIYPRAISSRGWTEDGKAIILYDNWDLWRVPLEPGSEQPVNLTGNGKRDQIRYRQIYPFGAAESGGGGGGRGGRGGRGGGGSEYDLTKPLYVGTYGEWTKEEGIARIDPGEPGAKPMFSEDAQFSITKADDADVFIYTRETFTEFPNYWVFGANFLNGYKITDANPQMSELAWSSGTRLIDYRSDKGDRLQGALYLPANYEEGKQYPLLVTIYEKRSQNKNNFVAPSDTRAPDPTLYTSRGYAVLDPDIVYRVNDPGMSAVWCVVPAVKAAIATGIVDPERVGLWGHSWGGYQTAFMVTQTDVFAAAVAGAALTDMVSMYSSVYWNTGGANQAIFESSQGRFKGNFIDNYDAYIRNSPAFHADKVTTPLMLLHNDKDGAVDFNQGITYFNTLRQLGKQVILLEYVGENHGLSRDVNQRDYARRMQEWFDHYLMGAPAPDWMTKGVPWLEMAEHLRIRSDTVRANSTQTDASGGSGG